MNNIKSGSEKSVDKPRVVIIGGGFGGLSLARSLKNAPVEVLLLDKRNYHTFQPLLYQVAIGAIEADSIAFPIRREFTNQDNFTFHLAEVLAINTNSSTLDTSVGIVTYDFLVIATGSTTNFLGNKQIEHYTMPMKSVPEALNLRSVILQNLETAHVTGDLKERMALLTFVVVGGGPAGVELAGALAEMRQLVLMKDYHGLSAGEMHIYLVEGKSEVLAAMSPLASKKAKQYLENSSVTIYNGVHVKSYDGLNLVIDDGKMLQSRNVFWTAGVIGVKPAGIEEQSVTRGNRYITDNINRVKGYLNIFAIGDIAAMITADNPNGHPGVAPVAIQQAKHLAKNLEHLINNEAPVPFTYFDKGSLATIGRNQAVADFNKLHLHGFLAWIIWGAVHIMSLAGFSNKGIIFFNWAINYFTKNSDNRLIIRAYNQTPEPQNVEKENIII
jgi:NADH dehydrogenase